MQPSARALSKKKKEDQAPKGRKKSSLTIQLRTDLLGKNGLPTLWRCPST